MDDDPVLAFVIPGPPIPKERPRRGAHGNIYTPKRTKTAEEQIAMLSRARGVRFGDNNVSVALTFHTHAWKGDGDNFEKLILDALQKGEVIDNDRQVRRVEWEIVDCAPSAQKTEVLVRKM